MPELRFTKRLVEEIPFAVQGQLIYRDTQLRGLGLRIGKSSKVYFVEGQVRRRSKRVSIGRADLMAPETARKRAMSMLSDMADGKLDGSPQTIPTVAEAFDGFLAEKSALALSTRDSYARSAKLYLKDWRNHKICDISRSDVLERHRKISEQRGGVTANNVFRHFRSVYNYTAAKLDNVPLNPVSILAQGRAWNPERRRRTVVTAPDLPAWWSAVEADTADASALLRLAILTGMRRSELVGLRWEYLDFACKTISLPTTKNGDPLVLPMTGIIESILDQRRHSSRQSEWVFPSCGRTGHIVETKSIVSRVVRTSGVQFTMHDLRRTFVTIAESLDIPHYALKRLLNHRSDGDVTAGYIVINAERLREPMERVSYRILELARAEEPQDF